MTPDKKMPDRSQTVGKLMVTLVFAGAIGAMTMFGCQSANQSSQDGATTRPAVLGFLPPPPDETGAQLWADNCGRCHNLRNPREFSPREWEVIVQHMRLRANLTGEEARKITEFLKASS